MKMQNEFISWQVEKLISNFDESDLMYHLLTCQLSTYQLSRPRISFFQRTRNISRQSYQRFCKRKKEIWLSWPYSKGYCPAPGHWYFYRYTWSHQRSKGGFPAALPLIRRRLCRCGVWSFPGNRWNRIQRIIFIWLFSAGIFWSQR